eukprot:10879283-Karenia_brevis.AAC.1
MQRANGADGVCAGQAPLAVSCWGQGEAIHELVAGVLLGRTGGVGSTHEWPASKCPSWTMEGMA